MPRSPCNASPGSLGFQPGWLELGSACPAAAALAGILSRQGRKRAKIRHKYHLTAHLRNSTKVLVLQHRWTCQPAYQVPWYQARPSAREMDRDGENRSEQSPLGWRAGTLAHWRNAGCLLCGRSPATHHTPATPHTMHLTLQPQARSPCVRMVLTQSDAARMASGHERCLSVHVGRHVRDAQSFLPPVHTAGSTGGLHSSSQDPG
jgi:hypothetical protein